MYSYNTINVAGHCRAAVGSLHQAQFPLRLRPPEDCELGGAGPATPPGKHNLEHNRWEGWCHASLLTVPQLPGTPARHPGTLSWWCAAPPSPRPPPRSQPGPTLIQAHAAFWATVCTYYYNFRRGAACGPRSPASGVCQTGESGPLPLPPQLHCAGDSAAGERHQGGWRGGEAGGRWVR